MKTLAFLTCMLFCATGYSQTVEIPDKNFELALIDYGIDSDMKINGKILQSDVQEVTFLDLFNKKIKSLKGIESFTSLNYLDCTNNYLTNLDLSNNICLRTLFCDVNDLTESNASIDFLNWFN